MPKVEKIRGLNLPGTPKATSACRGIPLLYYLPYYSLLSFFFCCVLCVTLFLLISHIPLRSTNHLIVSNYPHTCKLLASVQSLESTVLSNCAHQCNLECLEDACISQKQPEFNTLFITLSLAPRHVYRSIKNMELSLPVMCAF